METMFLGIVIFVFLLAIFDLVVGVSNDAVNFLNSAIGAKAAPFKVVISVAALGVFLGAALSNGMMEIARNGMFQPEQFTFEELMCIFLAVMVTDVILLDIFNTLGMPTSTTVSMVFELLGGTFVLAIIKIAADDTGLLGFGDLLNTEKALSVIIAIFVSVAIAFTFGTIVQYISRLIFTFNYTGRLKYTIGLFGGIAATAIIYFMLIKGLKDSSFMTAENKQWVQDNTLMLTTYCFIGFTILMQILHWCKVNVFKVIVLMGTFALATAFAGNDLVNFIGVPLASLSAYQDFTANANGVGADSYLMGALNGPATTPAFYLFGAGAVMVIALITSKKAKNVIKTSVDLSRQDEGDEMFGSSGVARSLVRTTMNAAQTISKFIPESVKEWTDKRFCKDVMVMENGAAFDLVRASVNLVLAGLLIALGTSLKLPLSTTYVTFMVAMGTSLADRAWGRETAVYRITGVLSVIGGWFITAGAAFTIAGIVVLIMYYGGFIAMLALIALTIYLLVRSEQMFSKKQKNEKANDAIFKQLMASQDMKERWSLLRQHVNNSHVEMFDFIMNTYTTITDGFIKEDLKSLRKAMVLTGEEKQALKKTRRKEIIGLRRIDKFAAIEKNTWFHLGSNSCEQMLYCMKRICEPCKEHVDNNFKPLSERARTEFIPVRDEMIALMTQARDVIVSGDYDKADAILKDGDALKNKISTLRRHQMNRIHDESVNVKTALVYLNILQESQELVSSWRHLLRASRMFQ
ncbi:MAG: inorganic phosphate transporter [Bacteroides sp.]|nr:inorganic phosphate transporter [Bacteroides sp.]